MFEQNSGFKNHRSHFVFLLVLAVFFAFAGCRRDVDLSESVSVKSDPVADAVRGLTGARTRVVWLQDVGDGSDYLARGVGLRLMGLDTDDGRGERVILAESRNMAKPMFTVDGDRVVYSDRDAGTMHVIGWEGGEPEILGEGFVLHTWRDPVSGLEWLYYARGFVDDDHILPTYKAVFRRVLPDKRGGRFSVRGVKSFFMSRAKSELVWDKTHVSEDNYMLSADGYYASAPFPWSHMGVHDVRSKRWNRHGRGCWTAMSPDNGYLFWIFDGPHRNLIMERVGGSDHQRWVVRINDLPETDRYEVYHPRWSNHSKIIAVTGPYKVGEGSYRLQGGGADVEIYLGRFADDYKVIDKWVRATRNDYANFYPDVWVESINEVDVYQPPPQVPMRVSDDVAWPSNKDALVYLWEHGAAQNEVESMVDGRSRIFRPEPRLMARYGRRHEMWLSGGFFVDKDVESPTIPFTMECVLVSFGYEGDEELCVFGYSPDYGIIRDGGEWYFRYGDLNVPLGSIENDAPTHLAISIEERRARAWINGELRADMVSISRSRSKRGLYLGGHPDCAADWFGRVSHVAVYARALDEREIRANRDFALNAIHLDADSKGEVLRARVVEQSAVPAPADIAPYTRGLVVNTYERIEGESAGSRFLAAHWAILDNVVLDGAVRPIGAEYELRVEPFDERPELEGERLTMDSEDLTLPLYYDLNL